MKKQTHKQKFYIDLLTYLPMKKVVGSLISVVGVPNFPPLSSESLSVQEKKAQTLYTHNSRSNCPNLSFIT